METLQYCHNVTAEGYSGHYGESAAELQSHYFAEHYEILEDMALCFWE